MGGKGFALDAIRAIVDVEPLGVELAVKVPLVAWDGGGTGAGVKVGDGGGIILTKLWIGYFSAK